MINELNSSGFYGADASTYDYIAQKIGKKLKFNIIEELGNGVSGKAYLIDDNKVLKITTSRTEVVVSQKLLNQENKRTSTIYNLFRLKYKGIPENESLYAIILEYLSPVSDHVDNRVLFQIERFVMRKMGKDRCLSEMGSSYNIFKNPKEHLTMFSDLFDMYTELDKIGLLKSNDVHIGNIGMKNNKFAIYDIQVDSEQKPQVKNTIKIR